MSEEISTWDEKGNYNLIKIGSYGVFESGGSIPLEYVMTTFRTDELASLTFARDISQDEQDLDFRLMMQRDIDEERAKEHLTEYLSPKGKSDPRATTVFFPPLLVACVPTQDGKLVSTYENEIFEKSDSQLTRAWGNLLKLEFHLKRQPSRSYTLTSTDGIETANISLDDPVRASFNLNPTGKSGGKLIAIDGQHRLFALMNLAKRNMAAIENLVVPVNIILCTSATEEYAKKLKETKGIDEIPSVAKIFRKIFVDVNNEMEIVGAHSTILLRDTNIASTAVRAFCDKIIHPDGMGIEGLSAIEWNVKSAKDSTILNYDHSVTSIGILDKALEETFGKSSQNRQREIVLNLDDSAFKREVLDAADDPEYEKVEWSKFSVAQESLLDEPVKNNLAETAFRIFTQSKPFMADFNNYISALQALKEESLENTEEAEISNIVLDALLSSNASSLTKQKTDPKIARKYHSFCSSLKNWRQQNLTPVLRYALFQRAIFSVWSELLIRIPDGTPVSSTVDALILILDKSTDKNLGLFDSMKRYTTKIIWKDLHSINGKQATKVNLAKLMLSVLGNADVANEVASTMNPKDEKLADALQELGSLRASEFWNNYMYENIKYLKRNYRGSITLSQEEIESLENAEKEENHEKHMVESGEISEDDRNHPFETAIKAMLKQEFMLAASEIKETLGFDAYIAGIESYLEDDLQEEEE